MQTAVGPGNRRGPDGSRRQEAQNRHRPEDPAPGQPPLDTLLQAGDSNRGTRQRPQRGTAGQSGYRPKQHAVVGHNHRRADTADCDCAARDGVKHLHHQPEVGQQEPRGPADRLRRGGTSQAENGSCETCAKNGRQRGKGEEGGGQSNEGDLLKVEGHQRQSGYGRRQR